MQTKNTTPVIDTSDAEKWLDPDTFVAKGKTYQVINCKAVEVRKEKINEKKGD